MALFRRNKTDDATVMPEEVNSYYQAENKERTWMAWLLALVTLAVTAIVIIGLFFGGRWVYRKVRHNNSNPTTAVVTQKPAEPTTKTDNPTPAAPTQNSNSSADSGSTTPSSTTGAVNAPANPPAASSATGTASSTPAVSSATPSPAANSNLPNTGPGDIVSIFAVVSIVAYVLHRRLQS